MKNLKFKSLEKSLVNPLVLFQKKFFKELNGSIFLEKEINKKIIDKNFYTLLCLFKNSIVGFLVAYKFIDFFEVHSLFVSPSYRRKGIAKTFVKKLVKVSKKDKVNKIFLEVMEINEAAKNLYLKNKFIIYGTRENYYSVGGKKINALLMKLEIM